MREKDFILKAIRIMLILAGILLLYICSSFISIYNSNPIAELDLISGVELTFSNVDGHGTATIKKGAAYQGSDPDILDFLNDVRYEIEPYSSLKNDQEIIVTAIYDESLARKKKIEVIPPVNKTVKVTGLKEDKGIGDYETIDGVDIPLSLGLDESGKRDFIAYKKETSGEGENVPAESEWVQGSGELETLFYDVTFMDFESAYLLADLSNQYYRIDTILDSEKNRYLYKVVFKEDVKDKYLMGSNSGGDKRLTSEFFFSSDMESYYAQFIEAYQYGQGSNQEFIVLPIIAEYSQIGWSCKFKE